MTIYFITVSSAFLSKLYIYVYIVSYLVGGVVVVLVW